jgi:rSAM-associated Gly-rich repeat protein
MSARPFTRTTQIGLLCAAVALCAAAPSLPARASSLTVEERLDRLTAALDQHQPVGRSGGDPRGDLLSYGFVNGRYGGAARTPRGRGWVNGHRYYGGPRRGFVNGGGYRGGTFANGRYGRGFANW